MKTHAELDETRTYRYLLQRTWDEHLPLCTFIMLNPSTADEKQDDPTIRRCIGYSKSWGYGGLQVVNLFAYRSTDPKELQRVTDPIGPLNDHYLRQAISNSEMIVLAWGRWGRLFNRGQQVITLLE